jgi:hypothetical protein
MDTVTDTVLAAFMRTSTPTGHTSKPAVRGL